jgi:exoribonuclease R
MVFGAGRPQALRTTSTAADALGPGVSYEQAQSAIDGDPDDKPGQILDSVLRPLWAGYHVMLKGRRARSPLASPASSARSS